MCEVLAADVWGAACRAVDGRTTREVSLHIACLDESAERAEEMFLQQARRLAELNVAGIGAVREVGVIGDLGYVAWECVAGPTLRDWLSDVKPQWPQAARLVASMAEALDRVHAAGVVHRHLHPANVWLSESPDQPRPVLVNLAPPAGPALKPISPGVLLARPDYLAPEQTRNDPAAVDRRTDVFALGVLLYRLLCGRLPFPAAAASEVLRQMREDEPQPPRQLVHAIPPELERACQKALAKAPQKRHATAAELADELRGVLDRYADQIDTRAVPSPRQTAAAPAASAVVCDYDFSETSDAASGPEDHDRRELLSHLPRVCRDVAEAVGGTVLACTDRRAVFRVETLETDAAEQAAVEAGLALLDSVSRLAGEMYGRQTPAWDVALAVRTARIAPEAEPATFPAADLLRELCTVFEGVAQPVDVVVSNATFRRIQRHCDCRRARPAETADRFEVRYHVDRSCTLQVAPAARPAPLVGRDSESAMLRERWRQAKAGMGQVVLMIGRAGIGKSRLVAALEDHLVAEDAAIRVPTAAGLVEPGPPLIVHWQCLPRLRNVGLAPAAEFFRHFLQCDRLDSSADRLAALAGHLEQFPADDPQAVPLFASLLGFPLGGKYPPLKLTAQQQKQRTLQSLVDWLLTLAARRPVLLVVEDLQWMDPATAELAAALVERGLNDRMLTVFTFRPEFETPWGSRSHQTQAALNRFTRRRSAELYGALTGLDPIPSEVLAWVEARAQGVPRFIEELAWWWNLHEPQRDEDGLFHPPDPLEFSNAIATAARAAVRGVRQLPTEQMTSDRLQEAASPRISLESAG